MIDAGFLGECGRAQPPQLTTKKPGSGLVRKPMSTEAQKGNRKDLTLPRITFPRQRPQGHLAMVCPISGLRDTLQGPWVPCWGQSRAGRGRGAPSEARKVLPVGKSKDDDFPDHPEGRDPGDTGSSGHNPRHQLLHSFPPSPRPRREGFPGVSGPRGRARQVSSAE
jgi:hypothetical protein